MRGSTSRRRFLRDCATWSAATAAGVAASSWPRVGRAVEPVHRNGTAKFKFSLAAYSYRSLLQGKNASLTLSDFIRDCADMQLEGTELTSYYFPDPVTEDYLRQLKHESFRLGLDISGTAVGNEFGHPEGPKRQEQISHVKKWIEYAEILGAPVIRIFAGHRQPEQTEEQAHRLMVSAIEECCEYAGAHGVHLALENHGGPTSTADGLLGFVHDVNSPWFGVNVDSGNFHGEDIYGQLERIAPYALNVQIKVVVSGPDGTKQPSDYGRLARIMRGVGYRGYIVLEYEEQGDPRTECARFIEQLREAFI